MPIDRPEPARTGPSDRRIVCLSVPPAGKDGQIIRITSFSIASM